VEDVERLRRTLEAHGLSYGVLIDSSGNITAQAGAFSESVDLIFALLGPYGSPKATFEALDGQFLPQQWVQGDVSAFVDKPEPNLAVAVFGRVGENTLDGIQRAQLARHVASTIRAEFGDRVP
jgi:hypothetical protein